MAMKPTDHEIASLYREGGASGPGTEVDREILKAARAAVARICVRPGAEPVRRLWRLRRRGDADLRREVERLLAGQEEAVA
mgnify:CR=1 FL=1